MTDLCQKRKHGYDYDEDYEDDDCDDSDDYDDYEDYDDLLGCFCIDSSFCLKLF